jgi:O-antigen/teichoic acid export membrane protein
MPEGFGRYSLAMSIALFFITFSDIGINQTLIRYASIGIHDKDGKSSAYFRYLLKIKFFVTLSLSGLLLLISYPLSIFVFKDLNIFVPLLILSFYVFIVSLSTFFESLFFIKEKVRYISAKEFVLLILKIAALLLVGFLVAVGARLIWVFLSFSFFYLLALFFNFYLSKKIYSSLFIDKNEKIDKKEIKKFILSLNLQNIALTVLAQGGIILLGIFLPVEYVGYYNSSLVLVISLANLFIFSQVFLPILTNLEEERFKDFIKKVFRLFLIILLPLSFGLFILSRFFIFAIYGESYLQASVALNILSFLIILIVGVDIALSAFSAKNKLKKISSFMVVSAMVFLVLNIALIKIFMNVSNEAALLGASIASLASWIFCFVGSVFLLKKELNIQIISSWVLKPLFSCALMSVLLLFLLKQFGDMNIFKGIILILIGAVVYLASMFLIKGIRKNEILEIFSLISKKKQTA